MNELSEFSARVEAAMLAAAIGDALGWPQENRANRVGGARNVEPQLDFFDWRRRDGGRFASHEVVIGAGEYSDDTQLIAAVSRSLLSDDLWWDHWTRVELPFWTLYERGGGGATKRAAKGWARGKPPWSEGAERPYFDAGGNGVAMRVLPHCVRHDDFAKVSRAIVADGIATHGHPRSLVGALAFGYTLWQALRRTDRLPYGALIQQALDHVDVWAPRPLVDDFAPDWEHAAQTFSRGKYGSAWNQAVTEMLGLLGLSAEGIAQGSLAVDREALEKLGAFNKKTSGAGTVTAAAAIFLASRYASRPEQGLTAAAFSRGADTDTIASMVGSLLAAINGGDWLGGLRERVQDDRYLIRLGQDLLSDEKRQSPVAAYPGNRELFQHLSDLDVGEKIVLPGSRPARLRDVIDHPTKTRNQIHTFVLETQDGQTLFVKRTRRIKEEAQAVAPESPSTFRVSLVLEVGDVSRSLEFWRDIAGLPVRITASCIWVADQIELIEVSPEASGAELRLDLSAGHDRRSPDCWVTVYMNRHDLARLRRRLKNSAIQILSPPSGPGDTERLRCIDPDGNMVEFREEVLS